MISSNYLSFLKVRILTLLQSSVIDNITASIKIRNEIVTTRTCVVLITTIITFH